MFGFALKSTMIYMFWNKFQKQIITTIISLVSIVIIFAIYEDINNILIQKQLNYSFELVTIKWVLISIIIIFNIYNFKKSIKEKENHNSIEELTVIDKLQHKEILNKKKLKTKSDVILQKYLDKKND
jgi:thiol:disulfide interchange protein